MLIHHRCPGDPEPYFSSSDSSLNNEQTLYRNALRASLNALVGYELFAARHAYTQTRSQSRKNSVSLPGESSRSDGKSNSSCNGNSTEPTTVETVTGYSSSDESFSGPDDVPPRLHNGQAEEQSPRKRRQSNHPTSLRPRQPLDWNAQAPAGGSASTASKTPRKSNNSF